MGVNKYISGVNCQNNLNVYGDYDFVFDTVEGIKINDIVLIMLHLSRTRSVQLFRSRPGTLFASLLVLLGELHRARGHCIRVGGDGEEERREHEEEQHDEDGEVNDTEALIDLEHLVVDRVYVAHHHPQQREERSTGRGKLVHVEAE